MIENQSLGMLEMRFFDENGKPLSHSHEAPKQEPKKEVKEVKEV